MSEIKTLIQNALKEADPADDKLWTTHGDIKLEYVQSVVGSKVQVTRDMINTFAPGFNQAAAKEWHSRRAADKPTVMTEEVLKEAERKVLEPVMNEGTKSTLDYLASRVAVAERQARIIEQMKQKGIDVDAIVEIVLSRINR